MDKQAEQNYQQRLQQSNDPALECGGKGQPGVIPTSRRTKSRGLRSSDPKAPRKTLYPCFQEDKEAVLKVSQLLKTNRSVKMQDVHAEGT